MDSLKSRKARLGAALLASAFACAALGAPAAAQVAQSGVSREDPAAALARHLRALAAEPKSLGALMGAGKAALQVGDPQAAITFFARAEEIAPRDGRIKAGFGSAFLAMEQPVSALKFFDEAVALGLPEGDVAGERGLAYDLTGDPRRAQRDYQIALGRVEDAEVRRRLALSLAITGDRAGALAAIQPQLDRKDRAAWRTRAFVLALTGDTAGATEAVQAVMPAQATAMRPFLARLPFLNAEQRALAVHYGTMPPGSGMQMALNEAAPPAAAGAPRSGGTATDAGRPDSRQTRLGRRDRKAEPASTDSRRRPGAEEGSSTRRADRRERTAERSAQRTQSASADRTAQRVPAPAAERRPARAAERPAQRTQTASAEPRRSERQSNAPRQKRQFGVPMTAGSRDAPAPVRRRPVTRPAEKPTQFASAEPVRTQPPVPQPRVRQPEVQPQDTPVVEPQPLPPIRQEPVQQAAPQPEPAQTEPQPVPAETRTALAATPQNIVPQVLTPAPAPEQQAAPPPAAEPQRPAVTPIDLVPSAVAEAQPQASAPSPGFDLRSAGGTVTTPTSTTTPTPAPGFGAIAELVQSLPDTPAAPTAEPKPEPGPPVRIAQADVKPAPRPAAKPAAAEKKPEAKKPEAKKAEPKAAPAKKEPSRIWVQIAGGADKKALPREFSRLKTKAPKLLGSRSAWTTPLRFTNRLLVGPFKTEKEAQAFVNELNKHDFDAFSWTSPAGQEIEKLATT